MITQERLKELFDYREDGEFIRKVNKGPAKAGSVAGDIDLLGYGRINVDGKRCKTHRLVWMWHHGYFPENYLDHINRKSADNRIENLREVSQSCNMRNVGNRSTNTSGAKGICWSKTSGKWQAQMMVNGKTIYLGTYDSFKEAVQARYNKETELGWDSCDACSPAAAYLMAA